MIRFFRPIPTGCGLSLIIVLGVMRPVAFAASADGDRATPVRLTLDRCVELARSSSPELRIATRAVESSRLNRELVAQSRRPQFSLSAGAGFAPVALDFGYDPAVSNGGELGARVVAEQMLYSGGSTDLRLKQADNEISQRSLARKIQDRDLVYAVRRAFIDWLGFRGQLDLTFRSVERLAEYTDLVTDLHQAGRVKYADLLSAEVELSQARIDSGTAVQSVVSAELGLKRLVGLASDTPIEPDGSLESLLRAPADTSAGVTDGLNGDNLDVTAARLDVTQGELTLGLARSQWKPTISLVADAGILTSRENLLLPPSERYRSAGYSVGLTFDMPLWDGGRRHTETARTRADLQAAEENVARVRRDVAADYRDTRLRLGEARQRLIALRELARTAEKSYLLAVAQYSGGNATAAEVLFAQQRVTETQRSEVDLLTDIQALQARLDLIARPGEEQLP